MRMNLNYKKMKKKLLLAGIVSGMMFSCAFEEVMEHKKPIDSTNNTEVKFLSSINTLGTTYSRLIGDFWEVGDAIGTYMIEKGSYAVVNEKSNVRYITEKKGHQCNFIGTDDFIFFPEDGREVRFMSYYPYNESIKGAIYKIDVSEQFPQSKLDFLYSFNTSATYDKNSEGEKVPIIFKQQMIKIIINIKNGEGLQGFDLMNMKVYFSGLSTTADFNLLTGEISNYNTPSLIYPSILIAGGGNVYSSEAIIIPKSDMSNSKIVIDMNNGNKNQKNDVYTWNLGKALIKGKKYTYNITVNRAGISVNSAIHNWNSINIDEEVSF